MGDRQVAPGGHPESFSSIALNSFPAPACGVQGALVATLLDPLPSAFPGPLRS